MDKYILYIYLYILLMPWNFEKSQMGILTAILFIWWIYKFKNNILIKLKYILNFKPLLLLLIFILFTYIATLWSDSITEGFKHVNKFHKYYLFIIIILFTSLNIKEAKTGLKVLIVSFGVYSLFSIMIYLGLFTIQETRSGISNPKGIMAYAIVSVYMAIGAISSFFISYYSKNKPTKVLFIFIGILCLVALFINKGRTAQLSFIFSIVTLVATYGRNYIFKLKYIIGVIILLSTIFYILDTSGKLKRYQSAYSDVNKILNEDKYTGSFGARVYFYVVGSKILSDNFLFGMGPEDNINELIKIEKKEKRYIYKSFHSQHLDTLTRYGFIGYLLLIFSIVYLLYKLKENREYYFYGLSFFIIIFYASLANVMLIKKPFNYIFITVFVLLSIIAYNQKKILNKKES